ncbi:MAG: DoxX family protein [Gemmatimonadaceae bacterium]|jgi:uncharacterized membrane protein YphA (DoxX/SURF4 family)|nr:DoxX family protein [Gemmatimonadaceae bacterium]
MPTLSPLHLLEFVVGIGLLNVWLLRARERSPFRGRDARGLREEFSAYGLSAPWFYVVGALKIVAGLVLIAGLWLTLPIGFAAAVVAVLMVGAIAMHLRVGDPLHRSLPAAAMLIMCGAIIALQRP